MAFFSNQAGKKNFIKVSNEIKGNTTIVKYKNKKQSFTVVFNQPSDIALKRFANTLNDIVSDIASKRASA